MCGNVYVVDHGDRFQGLAGYVYRGAHRGCITGTPHPSVHGGSLTALGTRQPQGAEAVRQEMLTREYGGKSPRRETILSCRVVIDSEHDETTKALVTEGEASPEARVRPVLPLSRICHPRALRRILRNAGHDIEIAGAGNRPRLASIRSHSPTVLCLGLGQPPFSSLSEIEVL